MNRAFYINWRRAQSSWQSAESTSTIMAKILSVIFTCVSLLFVQGRSREVVLKNTTSDFNSRRIHSGQIANPADFPYLIRLHKYTEVCGAAVISNYFIVTAAHCLFDLECTHIEIFPSAWVEGQTSRIDAVECIRHNQFVDSKLSYDIALIKTLQDILEDGELKAIPLPAPGTHYPPGTPIVIVGWGQTNDGTYPGRLYREEMVVQDWDECNSMYKVKLYKCESSASCSGPDLPKRSICMVGQGSAPPNACYGDSGGPLIIDGILAGVMESTVIIDSQCISGGPTVCTSVVDFLPWIYSYIEPNKDTSQFPVVEETA